MRGGGVAAEMRVCDGGAGNREGLIIVGGRCAWGQITRLGAIIEAQERKEQRKGNGQQDGSGVEVATARSNRKVRIVHCSIGSGGRSRFRSGRVLATTSRRAASISSGWSSLQPAAAQAFTAAAAALSSSSGASSAAAAWVASCLKPSCERISLSRSQSISGTLALTSQRPSGQTALPVLLATDRAWLPWSIVTQQPRQRRWPHESTTGRSSSSMQMAQQYSVDRGETKLGRHEWASTSEPASSSSGGKAWSIATSCFG